MSNIRILPEGISNKIAAGEVVERPASVVKELTENAIDAKCTEIVIEIEAGGRKLIRVSDNGVGMNHDDALLCLERHATSKIRQDEDLFAIGTLGFRGEAIPSIASVSRMEMVSRTRRDDAAIRILISGGKIKDVSETGAPTGTMITVRDLFFNIPARRKFLKTVQTEMGHITDCVTRTALACPNIHFRLMHDRKILGDWTATADISHRVVDILGRSLWEKMVRVDWRDNAMGLQGFVAAPDACRTTTRALYSYVNRRFVRDRVIFHAVMDAYEGRLMKRSFPVAVLFIEVDPAAVDVNVHPAKSEVRFADPRQIHNGVVEAISLALKGFDRPGLIEKPVISPAKSDIVIFDRVADSDDVSISPALTVGEGEPKPYAVSAHKPKEAAPGKEKGFAGLRLIGQVHKCYIVCESQDGFIVIDQHAAHERVMFEKLKTSYKQSSMASQGLLIPEPIELGHREADILEGLLEGFSKMGVEIEPFGGRTYMIKSIPEILVGKSLGPLIVEIVEKLAQTGASCGMDKALDTCFAVMACHGAVRANQALTVEEMQMLLRQLDEAEFPAHCPHGRPTWVEWTLKDIEKAFKRVL